MRLAALGLSVALLLGIAPATGADDPDVLRLQGRLAALQADPVLGRLAGFEQMEAQRAIAALADARRSERDEILYVADRRLGNGEGDCGVDEINCRSCDESSSDASSTR